MDRRKFLKTAGVAAGAVVGTSLLAKNAQAGGDVTPRPDSFAMLIDTTICEGCEECSLACAEHNELPIPDVDDESRYDNVRRTQPGQYTLVNRFETDKGEVFVKKACMHCLQPACATACLTTAMEKTDEGPIQWIGDRCMGCRYCMLSCPFNIPTFEYDSWNPKVEKCTMCYETTKDGGVPACVESCPAEALLFGPRDEILAEAHRRIAESPDEYVNHIYGEREAGGTGLLYLSAVPFEQLGFRTDLGTVSYPTFTKEFLYAVPIVLTIVPPLLLAVNRATAPENREHAPSASTHGTDSTDSADSADSNEQEA